MAKSSEPMRHPPVCDFCGDCDPVQVYADERLNPKKTSRHPHNIPNGWSACKCCAELIDSKRWADLAERALSAQAKRHPARYDRSRLRATIEDMHIEFREFMRRP